MSVRTVPNYGQSTRITIDLRRLAGVDHRSTIRDWRGNSYQGRLYQDYGTGFSIYELVHWRTTIAQFTTMHPGEVRLAYFNASYISATTRGFQGRILKGMADALGEDHPDVQLVAHELGKPTHKRGELVLSFDSEEVLEAV